MRNLIKLWQQQVRSQPERMSAQGRGVQRKAVLHEQMGMELSKCECLPFRIKYQEWGDTIRFILKHALKFTVL